MPTSNLGEGLRIRNEGAIKTADIALRHAAMRETEGIPQMRRSGRATQGWRDRPDPRNCPAMAERIYQDRNWTGKTLSSRWTARTSDHLKRQRANQQRGTRDRAPTLVNPRHDRREGAPLRPGMANCDYTKCTQRSRRSIHFEKNEVPPLSGHSTSWRHGDRRGESPPPPPEEDTPEDRWRSGADTPN